MTTFGIFAIVLTLAYIIYYGVTISQDIIAMNAKGEEANAESIDVSSMTAGMETYDVMESEDGFRMERSRPSDEIVQEPDESQAETPVEEVPALISDELEELEETPVDDDSPEEAPGFAPFQPSDRFPMYSSLARQYAEESNPSFKPLSTPPESADTPEQEPSPAPAAQDAASTVRSQMTPVKNAAEFDVDDFKQLIQSSVLDSRTDGPRPDIFLEFDIEDKELAANESRAEERNHYDKQD